VLIEFSFPGFLIDQMIYVLKVLLNEYNLHSLLSLANYVRIFQCHFIETFAPTYNFTMFNVYYVQI